MNILKKGLALALTVAALGSTLVSQAKAAPIPDDMAPYMTGETFETYIGAKYPYGGKCEAWNCAVCVDGYADEYEYYGRSRYLHNREEHRACVGRICDDFVFYTRYPAVKGKWAYAETDNYTWRPTYKWDGVPQSKYHEVLGI